MNDRINSPKNIGSQHEFSRRHFLGASALGAMAGLTAIGDPIQAAAQAVGVKPADLPDLTVKEVKVYVAELGDIRRINSGESGEIASIVTAGGIEGNFTLGNRVPGAGWLEYAKGFCVGKSIVDLLPALAAGRGGAAGGARGGARGGGRGGAGAAPRGGGAAVAPRGGGPNIAGGRRASGFVGGFGYPNGMRMGSSSETNYHASIVDVCLWDILGKVVNRPIYKLLGGTKDRMLAYASSLHLATIEDFGPQAVQAKSEGFHGYKIHPGGGQHPTGGVIPAYVGHIEEIRSVRKAVGDEFTMLFDPVQGYNLFEAIKVGEVLDECGYVSFEDPLPSTDIEGLIELRKKLRVPVEVGEFLFSIQGFAEYIRRGAMDIVRLIGDNVGGISGSFRIAQLAEAFGMPCTPHNWGNAYDLAMHFQIELAMPNCFWFEMPYPQTLTDRPYIKEPFRIGQDGCVPASTEPGLGVKLDHDALDKITTRIDR